MQVLFIQVLETTIWLWWGVQALLDACRSRHQDQLHVWVGGVKSPEGRRLVLDTLEEAGMQPPRALRVSGALPGLLLQFQSPSLIGPALAALRSTIAARAPAASIAATAAIQPPAAAPRLRREAVPDTPRTLWVGQVRDPFYFLCLACMHVHAANGHAIAPTGGP